MRQSLRSPDPIPDENLRLLNPASVADPTAVRRLLERAQREGCEFWRGTNRSAQRETARIEVLSGNLLRFETENFDAARETVFLNFSVDHRDYFFAARLRSASGPRLDLEVPGCIYLSERRDRGRSGRDESGDARPGVGLTLPGGARAEALVVDSSPEGLGLRVRVAALSTGTCVRLEARGGATIGNASVQHVSEPDAEGWRRVGLLLTHEPRRPLLPVERLETLEEVGSAPASAREPLEVHTRNVRFANSRGEELIGILDSVGDPRGAPCVIVPPAWGRTKESTLPLAETILATFAGAGEPVSVLRFDGIRRRGESHNDPECSAAECENLHYTFSQGVRDIEAALDHLFGRPDEGLEGAVAPSTAVLVSLSIASVEARRAIAEDAGGRIGAWVSIVGSSDPQSLMRVISGGVDYFAGAEKGLSFGHQYIQGLLLDVDGATRDAIASRIAFLDDARRDMAAIAVPITWIHARHDAWTSLERSRDMLSIGDTSRRRLVEVPSGHQLKTSNEAQGIFGVVAAEVARLGVGREVSPRAPSRVRLRERRREEMRRLRSRKADLPRFWQDYLVGRDGRIGIEFVTATRDYRGLMDLQVEALRVGPTDTVLDLGSGTGTLPLALQVAEARVSRIIEVDLVRAGLRRARERLRQRACVAACTRYLVADLGVGTRGPSIPLASGSVMRVLASLLLNYLPDPGAFLAEVARVLRPGGRLVLSGMRRDADVSRICVAGVAEIRSGLAPTPWSAEGGGAIDLPLQEFISNGARLLDLEEQGTFQFWDREELAELVRGPCFEVESVRAAYGTPPQANVVTAVRTQAELQQQ